MIRTKDLVNWLEEEKREQQTSFEVNTWYVRDEEIFQEIVARLKRYDKLCRDLKLLIARKSNGVDRR